MSAANDARQPFYAGRVLGFTDTLDVIAVVLVVVILVGVLAIVRKL